MVRIFFAVPLSVEVKEVLRDIQQQMQGYPGKQKWITPENTHLTLKFIGEIEQEHVDTLTKALEEIECPESFPITLDSTGVFPHPRKPRVLWVGIRDSDELSSLANTVDSRMEKEGIEKETRDFHPHLTLARVKGRGLPGETLDTFLNLGVPEISMDVTSINCYKSELQPSGAVYSVLHSIQFDNSK